MFYEISVEFLYLGYNTVLRNLEIRHYGPVCNVLETGLYEIKVCPKKMGLFDLEIGLA